MTPGSRIPGSFDMRSSAYATQFSMVAAVTSVQAARPKSPQCSGDLSAKKLTPRMEKTAMAITATNMAESTGSTACVKARTIFRRDLNCDTTRSARKTRTMRIDFTLAPVEAKHVTNKHFCLCRAGYTSIQNQTSRMQLVLPSEPTDIMDANTTAKSNRLQASEKKAQNLASTSTRRNLYYITFLLFRISTRIPFYASTLTMRESIAFRITSTKTCSTRARGQRGR